MMNFEIWEWEEDGESVARMDSKSEENPPDNWTKVNRY